MLANASNPGMVRPAISNSSFYDKTDAYSPTKGPKALLNQHIKAVGDGQGNQITPNISGCKFYPAPPGSGTFTVGYGVYLQGTSGANGQPSVNSSVFGYATRDSYALLGVGMRSLVQSGARLGFQLKTSTVQNCLHNGVEIMSGYTRNNASQPRIDDCTIVNNGFGKTTGGGWNDRHTHDANWSVPHPPRGHGVAINTIEWGQIEPTIQNSTIAYNQIDGIHSLATGAVATPTGISETWIDMKVKSCRIHTNQRIGIANIADLSHATAYVYENRIYDNESAGVFNTGEGRDYISPQEQIRATAQMWNNVIFARTGMNYSQGYGISNERYAGGGGGQPAQAHLQVTNDTVAWNSYAGIQNYDPLGNYNEPAHTQVWNTISFYNQGTYDIQGFNQTGQVQYSCYGNAYVNPNTKNINSYPYFSDVGGGSYGFHLSWGGGTSSPCVDKASNTPNPSLPATDFEGDTGSPGRAINKTNATTYWCDIGADEVK